MHHSDRGIQYASGDYTDLLKDNKIVISMSRKGNLYDNATCESFMKTLKYEEVYRQEYRDLSEARASVEQFIGKVYNQKRLHSALGYRPPVEFEQAQSQPTGAEAPEAATVAQCPKQGRNRNLKGDLHCCPAKVFAGLRNYF